MAQRRPEASEKLYLQALSIREGRERGLWLPKMWSLALRGHSGAMVDLADWLADGAHSIGSPSDAFSAAGLYRRAYRKREARAAHNQALDRFNRGDLRGYRLWLRRAVLAGDRAARFQLDRFETRLPHENAAKVRRLRPEQRRDEFA